MKTIGMAGVLATAALLSAANVALATPQLSDGSDDPVCAQGPGHECRIDSVTRCTKYTIVELRIGLEVVVVRQCEEETTYRKHYYWTP